MSAVQLSMFAPAAAALAAGAGGPAPDPVSLPGSGADHRRRDRYRLALGGHTFVPLALAPWYRGAPLYRCVRCHGVLPGWAITAPGWLTTLLGTPHCRELVPALPRGAT